MYLQIYLDIKCAADPEIKLPIVVLPAFEVPNMECAHASAAIGPEFGSLTPTPWSMTPHQRAAPYPVDPPPAYEVHAMYPSFSEPDKYQNLL